MAVNANTTGGVKSILRALRSRNYRLFFAGQAVSLIGTWMQNVALSWLVYRLSNSAFMLGVVNFAGSIPTFFLMPFAGVFADRYSRHKILVATQVLMMVQALILALLVLLGIEKIWQLIALSAFLGVCNAFDMPTRQAFVIEMLEDKKDLSNAIALNSSIFNLARMIGPSVAGLLIAAVGEGICFLINGVSYLAVIAALLAMRLKQRPIPATVSGALRSLKEGFIYVYDFLPIRYIILLLALVGSLGMSYSVIMPAYAKDILQGGPRALGFLMGCGGMGALSAALYLASRKSVLGLVRLIPLAFGLFSLCLLGLAASRHLHLSLVIIFPLGFGLMTQMAASNTMVQTMVDDDKRGRVMSIYAVAFAGISPFGALLAGWLAQRLGVLSTMAISGIICLMGAAWFALKLPAIRKASRPVYVRRGIIPEVAAGLGAATQTTMLPEDPEK